MFLTVVARPWKICNGVWFDGKIGIWPIVAKRDSKNRKKGNPIMRLATVNGERYKLMIEEDNLAIKAKTPRPLGHTIFVQQDGAKPHIEKGVMKAIQEAAGDGIILETQLANSPDLNINDLAFFHPIQDLKET
ncbi:unnamed protein product [Discosporangium mesarthrocarpum]